MAGQKTASQSCRRTLELRIKPWIPGRKGLLKSRAAEALDEMRTC
jgi:hypothetical protein